MTSSPDDLEFAIDQGLPGASSNGTGIGAMEIQVNNRFMREVTAESLEALKKANQEQPSSDTCKAGVTTRLF